MAPRLRSVSRAPTAARSESHEIIPAKASAGTVREVPCSAAGLPSPRYATNSDIRVVGQVGDARLYGNQRGSYRNFDEIVISHFVSGFMRKRHTEKAQVGGLREICVRPSGQLFEGHAEFEITKVRKNRYEPRSVAYILPGDRLPGAICPWRRAAPRSEAQRGPFGAVGGGVGI